jgi:flagellar biosynthesis/type III secretory pathway protein FliH
MAESELTEPGPPAAEPNHRRYSPKATVAVSVLIAGIAGLSLGQASREGDVDPTKVQEQALAEVREETTLKVRRQTARPGYQQGKKLGTRQGRNSGEAAGKADGKIQAQASAIREAQQAAAAAEAALAEISEPPPTPGP